MKILVCGPECSGKTHLAIYLSKELGIKYIPEFAVEYLDALEDRKYTEADIKAIAKEHYRLYEEASANASVVLDTFLLNLKIWSEYRFGAVDEWITKTLESVQFDRVLLMRPDIEWEDAPYRENPDDRDRLFEMYVYELETLGRDFHIVEGQGEQRMLNAVSFINV